ncbi:MAG: DNA polymerase I [Planctomycetota bacterium]|jgi:DNA polymerase-1
MSKKIYLIDGHAQTYRAFYAIEGLRSPDGKPSGAVYGFTRMLIDTIEKHKPDYLAVVFDSKGPTFRHEMYSDYKGTRKPPPPELIEQLEPIKETVKAFNIPIYQLPGYEADDIIGTFALKGKAADLDVVIVSGDKDLAQVLQDKITLYDPRKDLFTSAEDFSAKRKITPDKLTDIMGLWGDSSDNIPGVPGIGEKGAVDLILKYGSLENLLEKSSEIKGKRGEKLRDNIENARLSKKLATIDFAVPLEIDIEDCILSDADNQKLLEIYTDYGFDSLKKKLTSSSVCAEEEERDYRLINNKELFEEFIDELKAQKIIAFDVETTSTDPMQAELVGLSFSWKEKTGYYLPFKCLEDEACLSEEELSLLKPILEDNQIKKTGHNIKYDSLVMRNCGIFLAGICFDSMLASHLFSGHIRGHSLDAAAERCFGLSTIHIEELIGKGKKQITMDQVPLEKITDYAAEDADISLRLYMKFEKDISESTMKNLFHNLEIPLSLVLTDMQFNGILLDPDKLIAMSKDMEKQLDRITEEIYFLSGCEFNIASPKQLSEVLFQKLDFPIIKKTKTGVSTDEKVLHELSLIDHPKNDLPKLLLDYRSYSKLKNTYLDALPLMVNPATERIHTSFNQTGTATGRLSSSDPNLQNIPVRTSEGRGIRAAFTAEKGCKLISADYSQVELRMLAHLSGDKNLCDAFNSGKDIHQAVAAQIYQISEDEVTSAQRQSAKAINFGIIYGQSAFGLSNSTDMNRGEAQEFIDKYFTEFSGVKSFIDTEVERAKKAGEVSTMLGRIRKIPDLASSNKTRLKHAERMALNTIIQGSAADLIKTAMINIYTALNNEKSHIKILLQIHDELVLEAPEDEAERAVTLLKDNMESAIELSVPLVVDTGIGNNWLEVK